MDPAARVSIFSTFIAHPFILSITMLNPFAVSILLVGASTAYAAQSSGCGQTLSKGLSKGRTGRSNALTFNTSSGTERSYLLHIPDSYDPNSPTGLIWSYHGRGKDSEHQEKISKFSDSASTPGYIVVYPQGTDKKAGKGKSRFARQQDTDDDDEYGEDEDDYDEDEGEGDLETSSNSGTSSSKKGAWQGDPDVKTDDVKFTLELLDNITKTFCIDEDKVYASGISNGGGFVANVLACDTTAAAKFAAFASASGAYYQNGVDKCAPRDVPITCNNNGAITPLIITHGELDKTIPFKGGDRRGSCLPNVGHFAKAVAERDRLNSTENGSEVDNSKVIRYYWGQDESLGLVQYYYIPDMGHKWPQGDKKTVVSATKIFMEFFTNWTLTTREAVTKTLPLTAPSGTSSTSATSTSKAAAQLEAPCQTLGLVVAIFGALYFI